MLSHLIDCSTLAPDWLCRHGVMLLYLAPSALLALLIRALALRYPIFLLLRLAGTVCHELAHFVVGWLTVARPVALTVLPRRVGRGWELGSVKLTRVRWYNAAPSALAPLLVVLLPLLVAAWRTSAGLHFQWLDLALAFAVAPQFLACWPSRPDWQIALRSWPYLLIAALGWWALRALG